MHGSHGQAADDRRAVRVSTKPLVSIPSQNRRGKLVRFTGLYSAFIAVWLLSALPVVSTLHAAEWMHFVLLLVVLGSGTLAFAPSRDQRLACAAARVLWVLGVVMFIRHVAGASEFAWAEAGPAVIISHGLVLSLWASVITSATLVLWRDHAARTREGG